MINQTYHSRCSDPEISCGFKQVQSDSWLDIERVQLINIFLQIEMLVMQVLYDSFDDLGRVRQIVGKSLGDKLTFENEFASIVRIYARVIAGTSQNAH
jgi:hypothetical protein